MVYELTRWMEHLELNPARDPNDNGTRHGNSNFFVPVTNAALLRGGVGLR